MACRVRLYLELQNLTPYPIPSMFQMGPEREESSKINTCKWRKDENKCLGNTPIPPLAEWPLAGRSRDLYLANGTGPIPEEEQRRRRELTGHFVRFRLHYVPLDRRHGASVHCDCGIIGGDDNDSRLSVKLSCRRDDEVIPTTGEFLSIAPDDIDTSIKSSIR